jgi:cytoskeletal protein CcmA (bactofilin family)
MWKKGDVTDPKAPVPLPEERNAPMETHRPEKERVAVGQATIGPSITVKGEVSGDEDLLIQGRVEGSINLKERAVTVGQDGHVKADIEGRVVSVQGKVEGNLHALEQVILTSSAKVQGDIKAPRVVLEDGATFRGMVDMGDSSEEKKAGALPNSERKSSHSGKSSAEGAASATKGSEATPGKTSDAAEKTSA